jgi:hypothetical protein
MSRILATLELHPDGSLVVDYQNHPDFIEAMERMVDAANCGELTLQHNELTQELIMRDVD